MVRGAAFACNRADARAAGGNGDQHLPHGAALPADTPIVLVGSRGSRFSAIAGGSIIIPKIATVSRELRRNVDGGCQRKPEPSPRFSTNPLTSTNTHGRSCVGERDWWMMMADVVVSAATDAEHGGGYSSATDVARERSRVP